MRMQFPSTASPTRRAGSRHRERGSLVIALLMLLSILLLYVTANLRTLGWLKREIRLIDQKQVQRLAAPGASTNALLNPRPAFPPQP